MVRMKVSPEDIELAWGRFRAKWPHQETCNWNQFINGHDLTSEEIYRKLTALAGPHWETMLKMWSVQYREKLNAKYETRKVRDVHPARR